MSKRAIALFLAALLTFSVLASGIAIVWSYARVAATRSQELPVSEATP